MYVAVVLPEGYSLVASDLAPERLSDRNVVFEAQLPGRNELNPGPPLADHPFRPGRGAARSPLGLGLYLAGGRHHLPAVAPRIHTALGPLVGTSQR